MGGLAKICKMYGGIKVQSADTTVNWKYDSKQDKPVIESIEKNTPTKKKKK